MQNQFPTDYASYLEVMHDLKNPIEARSLDSVTLLKLYESKIAYLECLRKRCFQDLNNSSTETPYTVNDHSHIVEALRVTRYYLKQHVIEKLNRSLDSIG